MRFDTQALRILFGLPVLVTFSLDESHHLLMIRFARTRANDTCLRMKVLEALNNSTVLIFPI